MDWPATAAHGMAHAEAGILFEGALVDLLVQSIIAEVAGVAAIAIVPHSGPSRRNSISAIRKTAQYRAIRK